MPEPQTIAMPNHDRRDQIRAKIALGALFLLFSYVVYRAAEIFSWDGRWFLVTFSLLSIFFTISYLASLRYSHPIIRRGSWLGAYWSGWLGVFFGGAIFFDLIEHLSLWTGILIIPALAGIISLILAIGIIAYGTWQTAHIQVSRVTVALPSLPEFWRGKTIVFASDLHLGNIHSEKLTQKIVGRIKALAPEVVFFGGDLYEEVMGRANELISPLRTLVLPSGMYFVTGNHEYAGRDVEEFLNAITNAGITILKNKSVDLKGITVLGVDYRDTKNRDEFDALLRDMAIDPMKPSILLKHVPEDLDIAARHGVSFVLSGHTHNGQIWPMNYFGSLFKEFYYGHHHLKSMQIYVSSGAGTQGAPFRLGTKSEIVAITLEGM